MTDQEINARIAERVFNLVPCQAESHKPGGSAFGWNCYADPTSPDQGAEVANYADDVGQAWKAAEVMIKKGYFFAIGNLKSGRWHVRLKKDRQDTVIVSQVEDKSAARAMCLAILEALTAEAA